MRQFGRSLATSSASRFAVRHGATKSSRLGQPFQQPQEADNKQRLDYEFPRGGILISFRPTNQASRNKCPGPSAAAEAAVNAAMLSRNPLGIRLAARKVNPNRQHWEGATGGKRPKNKNNPTNPTNASSTWAQPIVESLWVSMITVMATMDRKTTRATPAMPVGKIENSFCTVPR
jgi:hypothetical protein